MLVPGHNGGIVATLPIRSLLDGKRRLAGSFSPVERRKLITRLCAGVVEALRDSGVVTIISIVSRDDATLEFGRRLGLTLIREEEDGLNGALSTATRWAEHIGAAGHLIVLPDLPLLRPEDVRGLVAAGDEAGATVVLCPDRTRSGTNALLRRPCGVIPTLFGLHSFERHLAATRERGLEAMIFDAPGTRWDLDTPDDFTGLETLDLATEQTDR